VVEGSLHFIDLAYYIAGSKAKNIHALSLGSNPALKDTVSINIEFENGSIANISYYSNGNKNVPKERIEVFSNGVVYNIDDFKTMETFSEKGVKKTKLKAQDKGHSASFEKTIEALRTGSAFPISFEEIYHSSLLTLESIRSITEKRTVKI